MKKYLIVCTYGLLIFLACLQSVELLHQMYSLSRWFHLLTGLSLLWATWLAVGTWDKRLLLRAWNIRFQHNIRVVWEDAFEVFTSKDPGGKYWHMVEGSLVPILNDKLVHSKNALEHVCNDLVVQYKEKTRTLTKQRYVFRRYAIKPHYTDIYIMAAFLDIKP